MATRRQRAVARIKAHRAKYRRTHHVLDSVITVLAAASAAFAANYANSKSEWLASHWYVSPLALAVGGHLLRGKYESLGAGLVGAAGVLAYMGWQAQSESSDTSEGKGLAYRPSVASYQPNYASSGAGMVPSSWGAGAMVRPSGMTGTMAYSGAGWAQSDATRDRGAALTAGRGIRRTAGAMIGLDARDAFDLHN